MSVSWKKNFFGIDLSKYRLITILLEFFAYDLQNVTKTLWKKNKQTKGNHQRTNHTHTVQTDVQSPTQSVHYWHYWLHRYSASDMHSFTRLRRFGFSRAAATLSLSLICLLTVQNRQQARNDSKSEAKCNITTWLRVSLSVLTAILHVNLEANEDGRGGDSWSYRSCKAPFKSLPPTNQHQVFLQAVPSCRSTNSVKARSLARSLSLHFNGHFPGEPGLTGDYWSKGWWRW